MEVWESIKLKPVYAIEGNPVKFTDKNIKEVYARAAKQNFSLFPLYEIKKPEQALIIYKSTGTSPNLRDLKGSAF